MKPVVIIGAGGIGCAVGYTLRTAGVPVTFIDANPAKVDAGRRDGVRVDDRPALDAEFLHFDDWQPQAGVPHLLCTKCYNNAAVLAKLNPGMELIPIQNGFDPQLRAFGHEFEGIASFVSECAPNRPHTRITRKGELHIGARQASGGRKPPDLDPTGGLRLLDSTGGLRPPLAKSILFRVVEVPDISPIKHTKLMYNAAISPIAAAAGIDNGKLLSVPAARKLFFALLQENHRILSAAKIPLGKVGPFHPTTVAWILRQKWLAGLMAKFFEPSLRGTYCSMAGEIQKGRTEIDNYNGHLIRLADEHGVPCHHNRAVFDLVVTMTAEREEPHEGVFEILANPECERRGGLAVAPRRSHSGFAKRGPK